MDIAKYITRLSYCSDALALADSNQTFSVALKATREELEAIRSNPYVDSTCSLPSATISRLFEHLDQLEKYHISVAEFCTELDLLLNEIEQNINSAQALEKFKATFAELLLALSNHRDVLPILERLSEAFASLPSKEKERLLLYKEKYAFII